MKWTDERATENQLSRLRQFGYEPDHPLVKDEASRLIRDFEAYPKHRPPWRKAPPAKRRNTKRIVFGQQLKMPSEQLHKLERTKLRTFGMTWPWPSRNGRSCGWTPAVMWRNCAWSRW